MNLSEGLAKGMYDDLLNALINANRDEEGRVICEDVEAFLLKQVVSGYYKLDNAEVTINRLISYLDYDLGKLIEEFVNKCINFVKTIESWRSDADWNEKRYKIHGSRMSMLEQAREFKHTRGINYFVLIWSIAAIDAYLDGVMA